MKQMRLHKIDQLDATIAIPGSKSYSARSLMIAALCEGTTTLHSVSNSNDTKAMMAALRQLHVAMTEDGSTVTVTGWGKSRPSIVTDINIGPAGTPARFLIALAATLPNSDIIIRGNEQMNSRPIGPLVDAVRSLGVDIQYLGKEGCPPVRIRTQTEIKSATVSLDGSISSQYFSALMLIAPALPNGLSIEVATTLTSQSYVDMTAETIRLFGATVDAEPGKKYTVSGSYKPREYTVEADATGAMNFLGFAAISGGRITISNLPKNSLQGDVLLVDMLEKMGCNVSGDDRSITVSSMQKTLHGVTFDMNLLPDSALVAGVVAAFADSASKLIGLATLKHKETDRLKALSEQLLKLDAPAEVGDDYIIVTPTKQLPTCPVIDTYDDHRVAMAFAIVCAKGDIVINDPDVVSKSFPQFWETLRQCSVTMEEIDG